MIRSHCIGGVIIHLPSVGVAMATGNVFRDVLASHVPIWPLTLRYKSLLVGETVWTVWEGPSTRTKLKHSLNLLEVMWKSRKVFLLLFLTGDVSLWYDDIQFHADTSLGAKLEIYSPERCNVEMTNWKCYIPRERCSNACRHCFIFKTTLV